MIWIFISVKQCSSLPVSVGTPHRFGKWKWKTFLSAPRKNPSKEKIIIIHIKFFPTKHSSTGGKSSTPKNTVRLHTHLLGKKEEKVIKLDDYVCWRQNKKLQTKGRKNIDEQLAIALSWKLGWWKTFERMKKCFQTHWAKVFFITANTTT